MVMLVCKSFLKIIIWEKTGFQVVGFRLFGFFVFYDPAIKLPLPVMLSANYFLRVNSSNIEPSYPT